MDTFTVEKTQEHYSLCQIAFHSYMSHVWEAMGYYYPMSDSPQQLNNSFHYQVTTIITPYHTSLNRGELSPVKEKLLILGGWPSMLT